MSNNLFLYNIKTEIYIKVSSIKSCIPKSQPVGFFAYMRVWSDLIDMTRSSICNWILIQMLLNPDWLMDTNP